MYFFYKLLLIDYCKPYILTLSIKASRKISQTSHENETNKNCSPRSDTVDLAKSRASSWER